MCQALQELMKDDIEEKIDGAKNEIGNRKPRPFQVLCKLKKLT